MKHQKPWTLEEIEVLRKWSESPRNDRPLRSEMAKMLGRSDQSVRAKMWEQKKLVEDETGAVAQHQEAWTPERLQKLKDLVAQKLHPREIGEKLGCTETAIRLAMVQRLGIPSSSWRTGETGDLEQTQALPIPSVSSIPPGAPIRPTSPLKKPLTETTPEEDLHIAKMRLAMNEANEAKKRYEQAIKQVAIADRIVDLFGQRILPSPMPAPPAAFEMDIIEPGKEKVAGVLLISDTHVGQVVSKVQTQGFGNYNPRVFAEKLFFAEQEVLRIPTYSPDIIDELHVFLLGDIVDGMLDHGAEREDTLLMADQMQVALHLFYQFFCRLAARYRLVCIHTVVGNHGRFPDQHRMPTKNRYSNFDHILYGSLKHSLAISGLNNILFNLNSSPRQVVEIKGWNFQAAHGDHLKGGDYVWRIPVHSMGREVNATAQRRAAAGLAPVDYFLVGDKHKSITIPLARGSYLVNGSFVGNSEYGMNFTPSEAVQLFFCVHPKYRKTWSTEIKLDFAPPLGELPYKVPENIAYLLDPSRYDEYNEPSAAA